MARPVTVLVLTPSTGGFYFGELLAGIGDKLAGQDGRIVLVQSDGMQSMDAGHPYEVSTPIAWDQIDGVVCVTNAVSPAYLQRMRDAGKPIVLVSMRDRHFAAPIAVPDNVGGTYTAVKHLIEHGRSRIGFVGNLSQADVRDRYAGYLQALAECDLSADPAHLFRVPDNDPSGGTAAAQNVLYSPNPPDALMVATDRNALGLIHAIRQAGWSVPDDIAIVGFDGIMAGAYSLPGLSTVAQRFGDLGVLAAELVVAQIEGEEVTPTPHITASGGLLLRGSCGCPDVTPESEGDAGVWRERAVALHGQVDITETALAEQFAIDAALQGAAGIDPRQLTWLADTHVDAGILALWDSGVDGCLRVVATHGLDHLVGVHEGDLVRAEAFPPAEMACAECLAERRVCIVVPVVSGGKHHGMLAVMGQIRTTSTLDPYRHWASQLGAYMEQQALQDAVRASEQRYALASRATNDGLWEWTVRTDEVFLSERCRDMLGLVGADDAGVVRRWDQGVHPEDVLELRRTLEAVASGAAQTATCSYRVRGRDGTYRWVLCRALGERRDGGPVQRVVGSMSDIHEQRALEDKLRENALHDPLTGLPNRRLFLDRLDHAIEMRRRTGTPYAVIFLDLDRFKAINDSLGHPAGDTVLRAVARHISQELRSIDTGARFGGDEFAILLHDVRYDEVVTIAHRVQARLAEPIDLNDRTFTMGASLGVATSDTDYASAEDVLRDADIAMYRAKEAHRGTIAFFAPRVATTSR